MVTGLVGVVVGEHVQLALLCSSGIKDEVMFLFLWYLN